MYSCTSPHTRRIQHYLLPQNFLNYKIWQMFIRRWIFHNLFTFRLIRMFITFCYFCRLRFFRFRLPSILFLLSIFFERCLNCNNLSPTFSNYLNYNWWRIKDWIDFIEYFVCRICVGSIVINCFRTIMVSKVWVKERTYNFWEC